MHINMILSNISKDTDFPQYGVTNCGFRKLVPCNLNEKVCNIIWYRCSEN